MSKSECERYAKIVNEKQKKIFCHVKLEGKSDYKKVKGIHDILAGRVKYAYEWLDKSSGLEFLYAHPIFGVLCQKKSVCEGIAKAHKMLLNALGVKCLLVCGEF